ncbi:MAG TPA: hypothetical protein VFP47_15040, partial [Pyrinomonadaceae bacterium]|nr:hypothetical protein [Pyrinomonadaceae bacterium]
MKKLSGVFLVAIVLAQGSAGLVTAQQSKIREYRIANERNIFNEFVTLLSIPNVASDHVNIRKNAV